MSDRMHVDDRSTDPPDPATMSRWERDQELIGLMGQLLDFQGKVRDDQTVHQITARLRRVNVLRAASGWEPLSLDGRWA